MVDRLIKESFEITAAGFFHGEFEIARIHQPMRILRKCRGLFHAKICRRSIPFSIGRGTKSLLRREEAPAPHGHLSTAPSAMGGLSPARAALPFVVWWQRSAGRRLLFPDSVPGKRPS